MKIIKIAPIALAILSFLLASCDKHENIKFSSAVDVSEITDTSALVKIVGRPTNSKSPYSAGFTYSGVKPDTYISGGTKSAGESLMNSGILEIEFNYLTPGALYTINPYVHIEGKRIFSENSYTFDTQAAIPPPPPLTGQTGPAGGIIFYDDGQGGGLEVFAPDWTNQWGNYNLLMNSTNETFGTGEANTNAIINASVDMSNAAIACDSCTKGGFTDWYLPSKDELELVYSNVIVPGYLGVQSSYYWSSSSLIGSVTQAWAVHLGVGVSNPKLRYEIYKTLPVRSF
jgi:hypothetical protein